MRIGDNRNGVMREMRGYPTGYDYKDGSGPVCIGDLVAIPWIPDKWATIRVRVNDSGKSKHVYATYSYGSKITYVTMKELNDYGFERWTAPRSPRTRVPVKRKAFAQTLKEGGEYITGLADYDNAIIVKR